MKFYLLILPVLILLSCSSSLDRDELMKLAKSNRINEASSIKAEASIMLKVPSFVLWRRIVDIENWQNWNEDVGKTNIRGSLIAGRKFEWVYDGEALSAEIAAGEPGSSFVIVSEGQWGNRILLWSISTLNENMSVILVKESIDGFWAEWVYDKEERRKSLELWLKRLKDSLGEVEILDVG